MKNVFIILFLVASPVLVAQELNERAQLMKDDNSALYLNVRNYAVDKWKDNHEMIVYEINNQINAFYEVSTYMKDLGDNASDKEKAVFLNAYKKWSNGIEDLNKATVNWEMVLYEMKNQFKAMNEY